MSPELPADVMAVLDTVVRGMRDRGAVIVDLSTIDSGFFSAHNSTIFGYLQERLRAISNNELELCYAEPRLFATTIPGDALYLAVCPSSFAMRAQITKPDEGVTLYLVGPYRDGCRLNGIRQQPPPR